MIFFYLFMALCVSANQIACEPYYLEKEDLFPCLEILDTNHDQQLNATEIDNFIVHYNMTMMFNATDVLQACDLDHDGEASFIEFNATNTSCIERRLPRLLACMYCNELLMNNNTK